jgi:type II secretory pathway pseudopilin PulG
MKLKNQQSGFSLIELLVYITITAVATVVFTAFTVDVINNAARLLIAKEVQQNARLVVSRITQEIKTADEIVTVDPTALTLVDQSGTTVSYYLDTGDDTIYYDNGTTPEAISNAVVKITGLEFEPLSTNTIIIRLSLEQRQPSTKASRQYNMHLTSTVAPRQALY